jgi:hypothetical protein
MQNKQTAVEWLIEELGEYFPNEIGGIHLMVKQAKEMEKEQHDLTFARGSMTGYANANGYESVDFEQYYNETYGK